MVCDTDSYINLNRESSKTRLMGTNVHPSRKTEVEKRDENEELITIKNNSRNSSVSSTISHQSYNNENTHTLGTNMNNPTSSSSSPSTTPLNHMTNKNNNNSENLKNSEINDENDKVEITKINSMASISSNLNLLEGELPQTMLENFDIPCGPITPAIATVVMNVLKQGGKLSFKSAHKILRISYKFLSELPNTTHCTVGPEDRLTVVGDLHGKQWNIFLLIIFITVIFVVVIINVVIIFLLLLFIILTFISQIYFNHILYFY